jgi:iron complex outermembrane receptor protein
MLTFGGRYTIDKKSSQHEFGAAKTDKPFKGDWEEFTPKMALTYQINDELMVYGLYSEGYRSGAFSGRPTTLLAASTAADPETVVNMEMGFKSEWFDRKLRINATIFDMDYQDKQEEIQASGAGSPVIQTILTNASDVSISGLEIEMYAYPIDGITISASYGYLDASYDNFIGDISGDGVATDNSNLNLRRAPENTFNLGLTYEWEVGSGVSFARLGYRYVDEQDVTFKNTPQTHNDAQNLFDVSVSYTINAIRCSLFGRNLTDEEEFSNGGDISNLWTYGSPRAPRTWGMEVVYEF